jgi:hypothetical protein
MPLFVVVVVRNVNALTYPDDGFPGVESICTHLHSADVQD